MVAELACIHVVAGALCQQQQGKCTQVLIAQRPPGKHLAGGWEFPGGKLQAGESALSALQRELQEELGVDVHGAEWLCECTHDYSDRRVHLELWLVTAFAGKPGSQEGQALQWVDVNALDSIAMLAADEPLVKALQARCRWSEL
jgi:8-oxo-dGTP diphosphatase